MPEWKVEHPLGDAVRVFVPHLTPNDDNVAGDWVFRSPAVIVATDARAIAYVPDLDDVKRVFESESGARTWLDYDHRTRTVTLGVGAYRHEGHVFFVREAFEGATDARVRLHEIECDPANPYRTVARFFWDRWGRPAFRRAAFPPFDAYVDHVVRWAFSRDEGWADSVWQEVEIDGARIGAPVFIVDVGRHPSIPPEKRTWREPKSLWNQAWFSTQRCANGLLRHARRIGSADLEMRARKMTELALAAPERDGLFPSVLLADGERWRWTNSDRRPDSVSADAVHVVDAAVTARGLLEWYALTGDRRARDRAHAFAARILREQRPSGAFPGWIEPDGTVARALAESAETAVTATLLFELGEDAAARRALAFLEGVVRESRWEDFETYWSCARWGTPGERVARNGVFKQNTLSIAWCAEAFMRGGDLATARRCLDELSLYQAVWDPPFLPAPAFGGFGVMNADAEWNDARQSLFAPLYLAMAAATGDRELEERGVAALRASFSMIYAPENAALVHAYEARFPFFGKESFGFMMENQGHDPKTPIGTFTIFTWGPGLAVATLATVRDVFPEIARAHGFA